jgi:ATP-dependent DNA helicase RecQ
MEESLDPVIVENMNKLLRAGLKNPDCTVYNNQAKAINEVVSNRHNVLYIDGTGNGKSESYFIACKLMRQGDSNYGPVIVVEPFNALIEDQLKRAIKFGLSAGAYNSKMDDIQKGNVLFRISRNELDLLYLTPEMIQQFINNRNHKINQQIPQFTADYKYVARHKWKSIPLIVIDEIHYISNVGHDFRTAYRQIWNEVVNYPWFKNALKLGMTATFNTRVEQDVQSVINFDIRIKGAYFRTNLSIRIIFFHLINYLFHFF